MRGKWRSVFRIRPLNLGHPRSDSVALTLPALIRTTNAEVGFKCAFGPDCSRKVRNTRATR